MPRFEVYEIPVTVVETQSLTSREYHGVVKIGDKSRPNINEFFNQVKTICNEITPRIYWRVSESRFMNIKNYIDLKCALNLISSPRIYALSEASAFILHEDNILQGGIKTGTDFSPIKKHPSDRTIISDVEILRCVTSGELRTDNPSNRINYYSADETPETIYTREYEEVYRKLKILNKGFPQTKKKPDPQPLVELAVIKSEASAKARKI